MPTESVEAARAMSYTPSAFAPRPAGLTDAKTRPRGSGLKALYAVLGGVISAGALICLLQEIFPVALAPALANSIASYQEIIHLLTEPIMTALARVLPFAVPEWYRDLWIISFVLTSLNLQNALLQTNGQGSIWLVLARTFAYIFFGVCILALAALNALLLLGLVVPFLAVRDLSNKNDAAAARTCLMSVSVAALAAVAFFALNSQLQDAVMAGSHDQVRSLPAIAPPL
jgi:hypothetical protein